MKCLLLILTILLTGCSIKKIEKKYTPEYYAELKLNCEKISKSLSAKNRFYFSNEFNGGEYLCFVRNIHFTEEQLEIISWYLELKGN